MATHPDIEATIASLRAENLALRRARDSQQQLLRAITDYAPVVLYAKDLRGRFMLSNRLHAALLDREPTEVLGSTDAELLGPEVAAQIDAVVARVIASGEPHVAEFAIPVEDEPRVFLEHVFPLRGAASVEGIGGAAIDITARKRAEEAARVLAALAEHAPDGVLVRPARPHARPYANGALLRIVGLPPGAAPEDAAARLPPNADGPMTLHHPDGRALEVEASTFEVPGEDGAPTATATIVRDVTRLRQAVREREEQQEINRRQQAELIAELSAPLLPLAPGVLLLPLIGSLDAARALHVREVVLAGVVRHQARALILDLTGLRAVDGTPADHLIGLVDAVGLVGARVTMTGIGPAVAAALVDVGFAPRPGLRVLATLADAIRATLAGR